MAEPGTKPKAAAAGKPKKSPKGRTEKKAMGGGDTKPKKPKPAADPGAQGTATKAKPAELPEKITQAQVKAALRKVQKQLDGCSGEDGAGFQTVALVIAGASGRATSARIETPCGGSE